MKITFEEELTHEGITFERVAVYAFPKKGEYYMGDRGKVQVAVDNFECFSYPILKPKKKKYTVIKVEGESLYPDVYHQFNGYNVSDRVVSVQVVLE